MRVQARIVLPDDVRRGIEVLRQKWNPERAANNPAHMTIIYHDEAPDPDLMAERLRVAASRIAPFCLSMGRVARFPEPVRGVYVAVEDDASRVAEIRDLVLMPPFNRRSRFGLHVTLLHPDQGERLESAWEELSAFSESSSFEVNELELVGPRNETLMAVRLSCASWPEGGGRPGEAGGEAASS